MVDEYNFLNALKVAQSPLQIYSLHNRDSVFVHTTQFLLNWQLITGLPDRDRHHTILAQALELHGFETLRGSSTTWAMDHAEGWRSSSTASGAPASRWLHPLVSQQPVRQDIRVVQQKKAKADLATTD